MQKPWHPKVYLDPNGRAAYLADGVQAYPPRYHLQLFDSPYTSK